MAGSELPPPAPQRPAVDALQATAESHVHMVRALCWGRNWGTLGQQALLEPRWPQDISSYLSAFGAPSSKGTQSGRGQNVFPESQAERVGLLPCGWGAVARRPDPYAFSPTERREAAGEPVHLCADTAAGGDDPQLQVRPPRAAPLSCALLCWAMCTYHSMPGEPSYVHLDVTRVPWER